MFEIQGKYGVAKVMTDNAEESCVAQISNMMSHPVFTNNVVIMPDTHAGAGSVIGFTMPMTDKIIPNIIGVDIGCGMLTHSYECHDKNRFLEIRPSIDKVVRRSIPTGHNIHGDISKYVLKEFETILNRANDIWFKSKDKISEHFGYIPEFRFTYQYLDTLCKKVGIKQDYVINSLGTLGGGNHFIEFGFGSDVMSNDLFVTVHSGSRKLGLNVAVYHQKVAANILKHKRNIIMQNGIQKIRETTKDVNVIPSKIKQLKKDLGLNFDINIKGLEYLTGKDAVDYLIDMIFVQQYASMNREMIMNAIIVNLYDGDTIKNEAKVNIESIHNYINFDDMIMRKGAIQANTGQMCVIPFNMEDGLMICEGLGNSDWNNSAAHGAGRLMGRAQAKRILKKQKYVNAMEKNDIYSSVIPLDEVKGAYKPKNEIIKALDPTVYIHYFIKPVMNIKAAD